MTQNVDDLHERTGSRDVLHLHGRIGDSHCDDCGVRYSIPLVAPKAPAISPGPPRCSCGGTIRPSVVWFGEQLPPREFGRAIRRVQTCDILVVVGTSGVVYPAAGLPQLARSAGALVVEIDPNETELTAQADIVWRSPASPALVSLRNCLGSAGAAFEVDQELEAEWDLKRTWDEAQEFDGRD